MKNLKIIALIIIGIGLSIIGCSSNDRTDTTTATIDVPAVYKKIYGTLRQRILRWWFWGDGVNW